MKPLFCTSLFALAPFALSLGCAQAAPPAVPAAPISVAAGPYSPPANLGTQNIVFPGDANISNVKTLGAKGDGTTDDSEAIQKAFNAPGLIYFPNGIYLVSKSFVPPSRKGKVPSRRILQGQSMAGVVIKLQDNTPAFGDADKPLGLFKISHKPEQAFRNGVRNLTIDTGRGNPGAIGMQFYASNQGGMHHVTIRSGDGQGKIGLDLNFSSENGPLLVKDIRVSGFDIGIDAGSGHLCTLEHVRVENQNKIGLYSQSYAFVRGFSSVQKNAIPAVLTKGHSLVTLIDANVEGKGGAAIVGDGQALLVRNLQTAGYDHAIQRGDTKIKGPKVAEWTAQPVLSAWLSPPCSLNLPIKETPEVPWDDPKTWANVLNFGPKKMPVFGGKREWFDVTEAFQKAIDSGATTVYFPRQQDVKNDADKYHLLGTVFVRGKVRRIMGMESEFREVAAAVEAKAEAAYDANIGKDTAGRIVIEKGAAPVVVIERFDSMYGDFSYENRGPSTLVLSSTFAEGISLLPGAGDLFIEDVCVAFLNTSGQNVWARQLNMERSYSSATANPRPNIVQNGGNLWVHGLKTEQNRTKLRVKNGAAEISAFILANRGANPLAMFDATDSRLSVSVAEDVLRNAPFAIVARETRGKETRELTHEQTPKSGQGKIFSLFVADPGTGTTPPAAPQNVGAKAQTTSRVALNWADATGANGYSLEQKDGANWKPVRLVASDENTVVLSGFAPATAYQFRVVAFNGKGQTASDAVSATTLAAPPPGNGTGLRAEYYANKYFGEFKESKTDAQINFDWSAAPPPGLKAGDFAVRWTGFLEPRFSEPTTFSVPGEGARLWLGDELVLNATGRNRKATISLEAGQKVPLKFEYLGKKDTKAILSWQSESQPLEPVPTSQLFPATAALPGLSLAASTSKPKEGETVTISIKRDGPAAVLSSTYTLSGDAIAGQDFKPLSGTATLGASASKADFSLEILDDKIGEPDKNLTLTLRLGANYNVNGPPLSLSLRDNDLPPAGNGTGLKTEFFGKSDFSDLKGTKTSKNIDFNWDKDAPFKGLDPKGYAIRWTGQLLPLFSENYVLSLDVTPYGGAKVWVDGTVVIDTFVKDAKKQVEIALQAGKKHDLKVEFVNQKFYGAKIRLSWKSPGQFGQIVPTSQVFTAP